MVSLSQLFVAIISAQALATLYLWNGTRNIRQNYGDDFDEMKTYRASQFRSELHSTVMEVLSDTDYDDLQEREEPGVIVMDSIEQINRDRLTDVEEALREYDEPSDLVSRSKDKYFTAVKNLGVAAGVAVAITAVTVTVNGNDARLVLQFIIGIVWIILTVEGVQNWWSAYEAERQVDDMIRSYQDDY
jgi:hypothetical protein